MIPKLHYISKDNSQKAHLENMQNACSTGVELVQLRFGNLSDKKALALATEAREITSHFQTRLIIYGNYKLARTIKADGVYLEPGHPCPTEARIHAYTWQSIGATANTLQHCETLIEKQVDYIGLGPYRTAEGKDATVLGLNGYRAITEALQVETPVIGFGGITLEDVTPILNMGISGIMVSAAITQDFNSVKTFHELLKASSTEEQRHTFK